MQYVHRPDVFPWIELHGGETLPTDAPAHPPDGESLTDLVEVDPALWLGTPRRAGEAPTQLLFAQTLYQRNGHAITMLVAERGDDEHGEDDDPLEGTVVRQTRWPGR